MSDGLIKKILVSRDSVELGEPFTVIVKAHKSDESNSTSIRINGVPGANQVIRFSDYAGKRVILVTAYSKHGEVETRSVEVQVNEASDCHPIPIIEITKDIESRHGVLVRVRNSEALGLQEAFCRWTIGELVWQSHGDLTRVDLSDLLIPNQVYQTFVIKLVASEARLGSIAASLSFIFVNDYAYIKEFKNLLQPIIRYDFSAIRDRDYLQASCLLKNIEKFRLSISSRQLEILYKDPERATQFEKEEKIEPIVVQPLSNAEFNCKLPASMLPGTAFGFAWHFRGSSEAGHQVAFSVYFEHLWPSSNLKRVVDKKIISVLNDFKRSYCNLNKNKFSIMEVQGILQSKQLSLFPPKIRASGVHLEGVNDAPKLMHQRVDVDPLADLFVFGDQREGDECLPDQEPVHEDLACQLTDEWAWVFIPARIINGRKGDTILSPSGSGGPVSLVLHNVSPKQNYAHTGIMIQNFYALRHSCASDDWLGDDDQLVGTAPTGDKGTDGIDPESLKYIWPGTVTQSAHEAVNGTFLLDPNLKKDKNGDVKKYRIQAFDFFPKAQDESATPMIEVPRVVSPPKVYESNNPKIRDVLHAVAERSKQIDGHYRFYAYTDSSVLLDPTFAAPVKSGWWASGTTPTMCSSFIWLAAKTTSNFEIRLEGPDKFTKKVDLEPSDLAIPAGESDPRAEVDDKTLDGLYFYSEAERKVAAEHLYQLYYDIAYKKAKWLGRLFTDAPDDVANQICNTFAFDWTGKDSNGDHAKDSDKFNEAPGVGRAVSPADILMWDEPLIQDNHIKGLYGYSEPLIFRPAHLEFRRVSRWKKVKRQGTVAGLVRRRGNPQPQANVTAAGKDILTDDRGRFSLQVPAGTYLVEAHVIADNFGWDGSTAATVPSNGKVDIVIDLKEPPDWFRDVEISGTMQLKDEENVGDDEFATRTRNFIPNYRIGAFSTFADGFWAEKMGGEVRAELYFRLNWQMDSSIRIDCNLKLFEGTSEDTSDLDGEKNGTWFVPKDAENFEIKMFVSNTDEDDDDHCDLTLRISNRRQQ
jgi:hypothetical protein